MSPHLANSDTQTVFGYNSWRCICQDTAELPVLQGTFDDTSSRSVLLSLPVALSLLLDVQCGVNIASTGRELLTCNVNFAWHPWLHCCTHPHATNVHCEQPVRADEKLRAA
eukprot:2992-Heterococcus_DN1.PRE.1